MDAKTERDKGISRVKRKSEPWYSNAVNVVLAIPEGWRGIGEDVRHIIAYAIGPPKRFGIHHNIHGALMRDMVKMGVFIHTTDYGQMKDPQSHARSYAPIYIRTNIKPSLPPPPPITRPPSAGAFTSFRP